MKTVRPRLSQEAYEALERMSKGYDRDDFLIAIESKIKDMETNIAWLKHQMYLARSESTGLRKQLLVLKEKRSYLSICGWTLAVSGWFAAAVFAFM